MSKIVTIEDFEHLGYDVVAPHKIFGRNSQLMSGEPIYEGGYRAVSADTMFGEGTTLVEPEPVALLESSFADSVVYQGLILISFILYLHMLLHSWGFVGIIWGNIFSLHSERRMANEGGELPLSYFKVAAIVVGILMVALVGVRITDIGLASDSPIYDSLLGMFASVVSLLFVLVLVAWIYALHTITRWITQSSDVDELSSISLINFVRYVVLLYPLVGAWLVVPIGELQGWNIALISGTILLLLIYIKDSFVFFIAKKIPILYWILYLCTAFLLPLSFIKIVLQNW